jgi:hypothetical protein
VLSGAREIVSDAVDGVKAGEVSPAHVVSLVTLLAGGFAAGSAGLAMLERRLRPAGGRRPPIAGGSQAAALTSEDLNRLRPRPTRRVRIRSARG